MKFKKIMVLILVVVLFTEIGYAYVKPTYFRNMQLRFYSSTINQTECKDFISTIPYKYLKNMRAISFFTGEYGGKNNAVYFWNGVIYDFSLCNRQTILHELAHNCQRVRGDLLYQGLNHIGRFDECLEELKNIS